MYKKITKAVITRVMVTKAVVTRVMVTKAVVTVVMATEPLCEASMGLGHGSLLNKLSQNFQRTHAETTP